MYAKTTMQKSQKDAAEKLLDLRHPHIQQLAFEIYKNTAT
jgi:hypothetical protein